MLFDVDAAGEIEEKVSFQPLVPCLRAKGQEPETYQVMILLTQSSLAPQSIFSVPETPKSLSQLAEHWLI
jgi:hypothetical protein